VVAIKRGWIEVNGYDKNDPVNRYAGIIGKSITSI